ncbi:MAG: thiolase family protein [Pararhodobacter sp.]|nr:thiolase family protein [Pararhodobacter sp.]
MPTAVMLAAGRRSPFGDFGRSLRDVPLARLGAHATRAAIAAAGLDPARLDHLVFGNVTPVDHDGYFISRKVALEAGLPVESSALTVNRACGSGTEAIASAARLVMAGASRLGIAAGGENFSRVPYLVESARWGAKRGPVTMVDGLDYTYRCPIGRELMGDTAEALADLGDYRREDMDAWGLMSQTRARAAIDSGFLARQIASIEVPEGKGTRLFETDEYPRTVTAEKLASLRPAFREGGRVTAGNSSGVTDGAAALLIGAEDAMDEAGVAIEARWVDAVTVGVEPHVMGAGPAPAIAALLKRNGLGVGDIDYWEINEAFAVVNLHAERVHAIPRELTNLYGGGISIGHPPGATGIRMTITAMHHLADTGGRRAVIAMCLGGGQGMATLIERV